MTDSTGTACAVTQTGASLVSRERPGRDVLAPSLHQDGSNRQSAAAACNARSEIRRFLAGRHAYIAGQVICLNCPPHPPAKKKPYQKKHRSLLDTTTIDDQVVRNEEALLPFFFSLPPMWPPADLHHQRIYLCIVTHVKPGFGECPPR